MNPENLVNLIKIPVQTAIALHAVRSLLASHNYFIASGDELSPKAIE
jgi:hypothetical protein